MLQWLSRFARKHRLGLTGLLVLGLCVAVIGWNIYAAPLQNHENFSYTIYYDDYTTVTDNPADSWTLSQPITLSADQRVYGLRLLFDTAGVSTQGSFEAWLESPSGELLATTGTINAAALLDGDFQGLPFAGGHGFFEDNPHVEGRAFPSAVLKLRYTMAEDWNEPLPLNLWCSPSGQWALQLMTGNTTGWTARLAVLAAIPLLLAAVLGWVLLMVRREALTRAYLVLALLLGLTFALVTPVQVGPDEYAHLAGSYGRINGLLGQAEFPEEGLLAVRECDAPYLLDHSGAIGAAAYKELLLGLTQNGQSGALTAQVPVRATGTGVWYLFLPQMAGILLGRTLGLGFHGMVLLARLLVLLTTVLLLWAALCLAPDGARRVFFAVGLLPMALQMSGALSTDGVILGLGSCYLALCLKLTGESATQKRKLLLLALAFLLGPAKSIYVLMVAFCAIIPAENLGGKRASLILKLGLAAAAMAGWVAFSGTYVLYILRDVDYALARRMSIAAAIGLAVLGGLYYQFIRGNAGRKRLFLRVFGGLCCAVLVLAFIALTNGQYGLTDLDVVEGIQANGDSVWTFSVGYVLHHLPATFKLVFNSFATRSAEWLQGLLGTALGEPIVYPTIQVNWLLGVALVLVLLGVSLPVEGRSPVIQGWRCWLGFGIGVGVFLLCLAACITWTPINYTTLFGMQGRYLLPVLPLLLFPLGVNRTLMLRQDKTHALAMSGVVLAILVVSQAFLLYCQGA